MSNNKATNQNANKDLSCLRCRKKKAKCSKTRPTCARCERSNHPCEYPDAPPNLTDLSKKVLDLYDSLRDLEGELLFKYMQPPATDQDSTNDNNLLEGDDLMPLAETDSTTTPTLQQQQQQQPSSPSITNLAKSSSSIAAASTAAVIAPSSPLQKQDIDWSMSYLSDGISIQTSTHTISDFTLFIDKLTRQLFRDFGTDNALSAYWDLDASTHGNRMVGDDIDSNGLDDDDDDDDDDVDDLDEDDYLVTVPIFDTTLFLLPPPSPPTPVVAAAEASNLLLSAALPTLLPTLLQYVHRQLKYIDDTTMTTTVHHHVTLLLHPLTSFLPAQDDIGSQQDPLTTLYIMTAYLTCTTFFSSKEKDTDNTDPMIGQAWAPQDGYQYAKTMLVDTVLQVTPTHGACLSAMLLLWIQVYSAFDSRTCGGGSNKDDDGGPLLLPHVLLDLTWRMVGSGLLWHHGTTRMTSETETIGAALVYLDTYITTFTSQQPSHLGHDIGLALRQRLSTSLSNNNNNKGQQRKRICMLLESQLMWFLSQVLGLFYTRNSSNSNNGDVAVMVKIEHDDNEAATAEVVKVRKVDVDEVLTLVRDLEQWEQQLPSWAMCDHPTTSTDSHAKNNGDDIGGDDDDRMMIDQLHLTLDIIKILLFRPFCTAFNQQGMEQTYTKTTFLDLSMHSASRLATCIARMKNGNSGGKTMVEGDEDGWLFMAYRLIQDVVERVRTTFDDDQDIKLQLDDIIHRIDFE